MSLKITEIYAALAAMPVSYTDRDGATVTPVVFDISETPGSMQTAIMPCRVLFPVGENGQNITIEPGPGTEGTATYTVSDFFLLESVARSEGQYIQNPVLFRYAVAYADAIAQYWQFTGQWENQPLTQQITITPGRYNLPAGSENWFYGVRCDVTIQELF